MNKIKKRVQYISLIIFTLFAFTGDRTLYLILNEYITLPGGTYRILIIFSLFSFFLTSNKTRLGVPELILLWFSFIYISRLLVEIILNKPYHISPTMVFINYVLGVLIPFLVLGKIKFKDFHYTLIYRTFLYGGLAFGLMIYIHYGRYLGKVARISVISTGDESIIDPLSMAYISSMIIGVVLFYFYGNRITLKKILGSTLVVGACTIPFFLGASRGAMLSVIFPFFIILLSKPSIKNSLRAILTMGLLLYIGFMLTDFLGDGLIIRISEVNASSGGDANSRIGIWKQALSQFEKSPIVGDGLKTDGTLMYPHNLFVETLLTTGLIGAIPMLLLIFYAFRKSVLIIRKRKNLTWLVALFLICFIQSMFSFAIYSNKWLWISMALLFSVNTKSKVMNKVVVPINKQFT